MIEGQLASQPASFKLPTGWLDGLTHQQIRRPDYMAAACGSPLEEAPNLNCKSRQRCTVAAEKNAGQSVGNFGSSFCCRPTDRPTEPGDDDGGGGGSARLSMVICIRVRPISMERTPDGVHTNGMAAICRRRRRRPDRQLPGEQ